MIHDEVTRLKILKCIAVISSDRGDCGARERRTTRTRSNRYRYLYHGIEYYVQKAKFQNVQYHGAFIPFIILW